MNLRRINWYLRRPGWGALMALLFLVAGALCFSDLHPSHSHQPVPEHVCSSSQPLHEGTPASSRSEEGCAICLFHSSTATSEFTFVHLPPPPLVALGEIARVDVAALPSIIVTLWSGRAPPSTSVS